MSILKVNSAQIGQSVTATNNFTWYQPSSPDGTVRLGVGNAGATTSDVITVSSSGLSSLALIPSGSSAPTNGMYLPTTNTLGWSTGSTERMRLDSSGNLGLGVTPSSTTNWLNLFVSKAIIQGRNADGSVVLGSNQTGAGAYYTSNYAMYYYQNSGNGTHAWYNAPSGTAGNAISFTQAMTLDASGNLLVGTTTSTARLTTTSAGAEGTVEVSFINGGCQFFVNSVGGANAAATVQRIGRISTNSRSINAGGTINASGADYAEYMIKAGDFEIAKGEVCGIDANGLLTNVFADAVSFVVKSTDPSYVGGDSWGAEIEDADALEIARQKVDRIAFAGQVPVNVLGAKAGDYIIPIADGTGIKGTAVASPTFEQYQIAVGKVIAIESDGRARIIVKVA